MQPPSALIPKLGGKTIDNGRLMLTEIIGQGAWGVVYLAKVKKHMSLREALTAPLTSGREGGSSDQVFAVKVFSSELYKQDFLSKEFAYQNLCSSNCSGVLPILNLIEDPRQKLIFMVSDFCSDGDLLDVIYKDVYMGKDDLIKDVYLQIIDAVQACHDIGIFHRDLKPENILCKDGGKKIFLADFGFASLEEKSSAFHLGSLPFMSPEIRELHGGRYYSSRAGDVWAIGVILMNIICGFLPWYRVSVNDASYRRYLHNSDYLYNYFPITREVSNVMKRIFTHERARISLPDLRKAILKIDKFTTLESGTSLATLELPKRQTRVRQHVVVNVTVEEELGAPAPASVPTTESDITSMEEREPTPGRPRSPEMSPLNPFAISSPSDDSEVTVISVRNDSSDYEGRESSFVNGNNADTERDSDIDPFILEPLTGLRIEDALASATTLADDSSSSSSSSESEFNSSTESEDESEGPITPETRAVDATIAGTRLEDVPPLPESAQEQGVDITDSAAESSPNPNMNLGEPWLLVFPEPPTQLPVNPKGIARGAIGAIGAIIGRNGGAGSGTRDKALPRPPVVRPERRRFLVRGPRRPIE